MRSWSERRTRSRSENTSRRAAAPDSPWWSRKGPAICLPTRIRGSSAESGSWKIMAALAPRIAVSSLSELPMTFTPAMVIQPDARMDSGRRPRRERAVIDFPEPDSPMRPSRPPRSRSKLTPCRSTRSGLRSDIARFSTSSSFMGLLHLRIEQLPDPVPKEIEAQHGRHDGEPRKNGAPWTGNNRLLRFQEHAPPGGLGRRSAKAQVRKGRLSQDGARGHQRELHDEDRIDVGQDVAEDDGKPRRSPRDRSLHVVRGQDPDGADPREP